MITVILLTKNNQDIISQCLNSVSWAGELIVVDDYSTDETTALVKQFGAKVYKRRLSDDFAAQRNFGLSKASGEWVMFIDSDEAVTKELRNEIEEVIKSSSANGFLFKRQDIFMGKKMIGGEWGNAWLLRLARKTAGKWTRQVHEVWNVKGEVGKLTFPLLHSPHPSLKSFLAKLNFYSTIHAQSNLKEGKSANLIKIIFMPTFKFAYNFIIRGGYKDGVHGFVYSVFLSLHSYLAWSKLWILQKKG